MSRTRGVWCLVAALLVYGAVAAVWAGGASGPGAPAAMARSTGLMASAGPAVASAKAGAGTVVLDGALDVVLDGALDVALEVAPRADRGPACAPGVQDHGQAPAVPPRGAGEHGHAPVARLAAEPGCGCWTMPARVLVRGPCQRAPGPVELSVMRV